MSFLLKSKPKRNYNYKFISIFAVFAILLLLSFLFPNFFRSASQTSMKPLWLLRDKTKSSFYYVGNFFIWKNSLIKENTRLHDEIEKLKLSKLDYEFLQKENEAIKEQLGRGEMQNRIAGSILSKPPQSPFDTFVIDAGENAGVEIGSKVYISDTIILGLVSNVTRNTSIVKLFSSGNEKTQATLSRTGSTFELIGEGGANFSLEVPKDTDIVWGDSFEHPATNKSVIGVVYFVDSNSQSSFKTIHIRYPVNIFQAKQVFILK